MLSEERNKSTAVAKNTKDYKLLTWYNFISTVLVACCSFLPSVCILGFFLVCFQSAFFCY